jgi:hopene-associated glycosyltransferase HpnB
MADEPFLTTSALVALAAWLVLLLARGGFWRADQLLSAPVGAHKQWPAVVAIIPARNEEPFIGSAVASILTQAYAGPLTIIVVDDGSTDGTARRARNAAVADPRLIVLEGTGRPDGWSGKLWAVQTGIAYADESHPDAAFLWLTDADIIHDRQTLTKLVAKALADDLALVSLMVRLRSIAHWERILVPAFVFFFQKLFPFPWVNDPNRTEAAAAGGCMLVRRRMLAAAGGIARIRDAVIDDVALATLIKPHGPIWIGLGVSEASLRPYDRLADFWTMVARTAFVQLGRSWLRLAGTIIGMVFLYAIPPVATVVGVFSVNPVLAGAGAAAWIAMAVAYKPTLVLYGQSPLAGFLLPGAALLFVAMTADSARLHALGRGSAWKGRTYG